MDTSLDAYLVVLTIPVCFVSDRYSIPSVGIYSSEPSTYTPDDALSEYVRLKTKNDPLIDIIAKNETFTYLLLQMMMVGIRIIESACSQSKNLWSCGVHTKR